MPLNQVAIPHLLLLMMQWQNGYHKRAESLLNADNGSFSNADNTMNWQPLVYWYGKDGFGDVKKAIDQALRQTSGNCAACNRFFLYRRV